MTSERVGMLPVSWELFKAIMFVILAIAVYEFGKYLVHRAASSVVAYFRVRISSSNVDPPVAPPAAPPAFPPADVQNDADEEDDDAGETNPSTVPTVVYVTQHGNCFHVRSDCRSLRGVDHSGKRPCLICSRAGAASSSSAAPPGPRRRTARAPGAA